MGIVMIDFELIYHSMPHLLQGVLVSCQIAFMAAAIGLLLGVPLAFARRARFPTALRVPSRSSVTLWEETAPVKLPTMHGP